MRFAYIDSQGKEVEIPSVDALRLRIELGAIVDSTIFHDSNTGKWAPAAEHEIYRTLQRELTELGAGGFTAPPPVPGGPSGGGAPSGDRGPGPASAAPGPPTGGDEFVLGFEVELAPELSEAYEPPLERRVEAEAPAPVEERAEAESGSAPVAEAAGSGAENREENVPLSSEWGEEGDTPEAEDVSDTAAASLEAGEELPDWAAPAAPGDAPSRLGLEPSADEGPEGRTEPPPPVRGMDMEAPLSEYDADQPPEWMRKETPADWASPAPEAPVPEDRPTAFDPLAPRPEPRPRSAPPPRKLTRARTPGAGRVVALLAVLGVAAVGVWYGSGYLAGMLGAGGPGAQGPSLPSLPPELQSRMARLAEGAVDTMAARLDRLPEREALPAAPNTEWLAGAYLAAPSRFPDVPGYWESVLTFVEAAEAAEDQLFRAAFEAGLAESALSAEEAEGVLERGLAGWEAAASDRARVHRQLRTVAEASLTLHEFLMANEGQISYEPAAGGVSRDPVLEAVPASEALGVAMWDRVGAITGALDTLGFLETIETDGLVMAYLERLRTRAVR